MRTNLPITQQEYVLRDGATIVSRTDLKGKITYINDDFLEASGFTTSELIGQPHNLVRHPDMPEEAFADLWKTLQAGKPWTGLVKNRRKNGDHYWVVANATPVREGRCRAVRCANWFVLEVNASKHQHHQIGDCWCPGDQGHAAPDGCDQPCKSVARVQP